MRNTKQQKRFQNLAIFDWEKIYVQEETLKDTKTTRWKRKHVPISVSFSNNVEEPFFICNSDPHHLVASSIGFLEFLAVQSKSHFKLLFIDIETTKKVKVASTLEKFIRDDNRLEQTSDDDCEMERCASAQFLQIQCKI